jgi:hypothetical protein
MSNEQTRAGDVAETSDTSVRETRATSVYDAALLLYGVLAGLALIDPLNLSASDIIDKPFSGNWQLRFIALGLLIEMAGWIHLLLASIRAQTLGQASSPRHRSLPGSVAFGALWWTEVHFWAGGTLVVALIVMAKAAAKSMATFLSTYLAYRLIDLSWLLIFLIFSWGEGQPRVSAFFKPLRLIRQLELARHVPMSDVDVAIIRRGGNSIDDMWDGISWFYIWIAVINVALSGVLLAFAIMWPIAGAAIAASWLILVLATNFTLQHYVPQFYSL